MVGPEHEERARDLGTLQGLLLPCPVLRTHCIPPRVLPRKGSTIKRAEVVFSLLLNLETSSLLSLLREEMVWVRGAGTGAPAAGKRRLQVGCGLQLPVCHPPCGFPDLLEHLSRPLGKGFWYEK